MGALLSFLTRCQQFLTSAGTWPVSLYRASALPRTFTTLGLDTPLLDLIPMRFRSVMTECARMIERRIRRKDPRTPIKGIVPKLKNLAFMHYRGLLGFFIPFCALIPIGLANTKQTTTKCVWMWMFWSFLLQPVNVPCTAMIPIFIFPMTGVLSSGDVCGCYFNEIVTLLILACMIHLLLNNSGADRRIALNILCSGDACQYSGKRLVFKCSTAAYFLSIFSNRLIVTSYITQIVAPPLTSLQSSTARNRRNEPEYNEMRNIVCNAIQVSSALGSTVIIHGALATIALMSVWSKCAPEGKVYQDIFNYLQYTCYTFPVTFAMYILCMCYHMLMINMYTNKPMGPSGLNEVKNALTKHQKTLPKSWTTHEMLTVFFQLLALAMFLFRWSSWLGNGWTTFRKEETTDELPFVKDATVAALFVIILHVLPKGASFIKIFMATQKKDLPPAKAESAILWWRFVDRNTNYGYMFMMGSALALHKAIEKSELQAVLVENLGKKLTDKDFMVGLLLVIIITVILCNVMSGCAGVSVFLPFVINMSASPAGNDWQTKLYLGALAVGIGSSFGFCCPFLYTPAYFCHNTGKVPKLKMAKYSFIPAWICGLVLWASLLYFAPVIFGESISPVTAPVTPGAKTTEAAAGGGGGGGGGDEAAPPAELI